VFDDESYSVIVSLLVILIDKCFSRKKRGHRPTGKIVQKARNAGYSSVSDMLNVKVHDNLGHEMVVENMGFSLKNLVASSKV
jgi:hypothetical protein